MWFDTLVSDQSLTVLFCILFGSQLSYQTFGQRLKFETLVTAKDRLIHCNVCVRGADIDECSLNADLCDHGRCINYPGGYRCHCDMGFTGRDQEQQCVGEYHTHTHARTQPFNGLWSGTTRVGRYQKKHSPTHTPSWSSDILYQLPPSTTIHSILFVQFTCLTVFFHNLSSGPIWSSFWSSFWSWTLYFIFHAFLHPVIIFSLHMPIPTQPVML